MSRNQPRNPFFGSDWEDRIIIPDVYPRQDDPNVPAGFLPAPTGTPGMGPTLAPAPGTDLYNSALTVPGMRPVVYQRAQNLTIPATDQPLPLASGSLNCEAFLINVPSTSVNSAFFGFGAGISSVNGGIEVQPGIPLFFSPSNIREQWELQRLLEAITALLGFAIGSAEGAPPIPTPGQYMAPRVVLNAHDYYIVNAAGISQNVSVMLFTVPEFQ
jgi:hypothetical protein